MTYTLLPVEDFGGLDLSTDPEEADGAIDLLNVQFDRPGRVRSRMGYAALASGSGASDYFLGKLFFTSSSYYVTSHYSGTLDLVTLNDSGTVIATQSNVGTLYSAVDASTATSKLTYLVAVTAADAGACYSTTGTMAANAFTLQAGVPVTGYSHLAVQQPDNRLVVINAAAGAGPSKNNKVSFSEPGDHTNFLANSYVGLDPGSRDRLNGICTWNDLTFVFTPRKFFVFYGNSVNPTGDPTDGSNTYFNVREVDTGIGLKDALRASTEKPLPPLAVAPEGVYFLNHDGLYITTGGPPTRIPSPMDVYFQGERMPWFSAVVDGDLTTAQSTDFLHLAYTDGRLYCAIQNKIFLLDVPTGRWTYWSIPVNPLGLDSLAVIRDKTFTFIDDLWFVARRATGAVPANGGVYYFQKDLTTDAGTAITSFYRSGFTDFGFPGQEKTVRETELVGTGTVGFAWSRDFGSVPTASNVTLGALPATVARGLHRDAQCGELLSWKASSVTGGAWTLSRVVPALRDVRGALEKTA